MNDIPNHIWALIGIGLTTLFGVISIWLYFRERKRRRELEKEKTKHRNLTLLVEPVSSFDASELPVNATVSVGAQNVRSYDCYDLHVGNNGNIVIHEDDLSEGKIKIRFPEDVTIIGSTIKATTSGDLHERVDVVNRNDYTLEVTFNHLNIKEAIRIRVLLTPKKLSKHPDLLPKLDVTIKDLPDKNSLTVDTLAEYHFAQVGSISDSYPKARNYISGFIITSAFVAYIFILVAVFLGKHNVTSTFRGWTLEDILGTALFVIMIGVISLIPDFIKLGLTFSSAYNKPDNPFEYEAQSVGVSAGHNYGELVSEGDDS